MRHPTEQAHCSGLYPPPANVARGFHLVTGDWRRRKPLTYLNLFICCSRFVPKSIYRRSLPVKTMDKSYGM